MAAKKSRYSHTLTSSYRPKKSGIYPICRLTPIGSLRMSAPLSTAVPAVGSNSVAIIRMVVVFPAPFEPMNPRMSPGWRLNEIPLTAVRPPYSLRRFLTSSIFVTLWEKFHFVFGEVKRLGRPREEDYGEYEINRGLQPA